jgi:threonine synthase
VPNLFVKYEGMNPTGSFKDRGMVMAISKAVEEGCKAVICASTGNTSASAAAYGAVAGLETIIVLPKGKIALGKMIQGIAAGAKVLAVDGNFDDAFRVVREMAEQKDHPVTLVNHINPNRVEGQTTAAYEVCDDLGRRPTSWRFPSATPATSPPTGSASTATRRPAESPPSRRCTASRRRARRRS